MKKTLVFLVMMVGVMGSVMAQTDTTDICFTPTGVVNFEVTPSLIFPSVIPGTDTSIPSKINLTDINTEDLTLNVYLQTNSDNIFTNVVLSTSDSDVIITPPGKLAIGSGTPVVINVNDVDTEGLQTNQSNDILETLSVPLGTLPSVRNGVIIYEVVGPAPIDCTTPQ